MIPAGHKLQLQVSSMINLHEFKGTPSICYYQIQIPERSTHVQSLHVFYVEPENGHENLHGDTWMQEFWT